MGNRLRQYINDLDVIPKVMVALTEILLFTRELFDLDVDAAHGGCPYQRPDLDSTLVTFTHFQGHRDAYVKFTVHIIT